MGNHKSLSTETASVHTVEHVTFHLSPAEVWEPQAFGPSYRPERFAEEGFIHCTDTLEELVAVGNRYYRTDPRDFLVLAIDCVQVTASVVYEDERQIFPHIYGPLNTDAVLSVQRVVRAADGAFLTMG
jgi:uncharacterized protein (DUF952 family)